MIKCALVYSVHVYVFCPSHGGVNLCHFMLNSISQYIQLECMNLLQARYSRVYIMSISKNII